MKKKSAKVLVDGHREKTSGISTEIAVALLCDARHVSASFYVAPPSFAPTDQY